MEQITAHGAPDVEAALVDAMANGSFGSSLAALVERSGELDDASRALVERVEGLSRGLADATRSEADRIAARFRDAGIPTSITPSEDRKLHVFPDLVISSGLDRALELLDADGWYSMIPMGKGAWAGYRHAHNGGVFIKHDDPTRRLHLSWAPKREHHKLVKLLTPQAPDVTAMELPTFLWPGYWAIRLGRLVKEQVSRNKLVGGGDLGPSLATPRGLIGPILELADTTPDDVVVDLGSGDGRVVVEAARLGATARGIERDPALVQQARRAIAEAGVQRATIVEGSALDAQLADATVVFLFVAPKFVADLLPGLLAKLPTGARIVTHQQQPVTWPLEPAAAELMLGADGISSAYLWRVG